MLNRPVYIRRLIYLILLALLVAVVPVLVGEDGVSAQDSPNQDLPWWSDRVFYEVFVRSFYDSDGDGIGDLRGLIEKLDYLNDGDPTTTDDLGVTGIWLMPIMQSPSYHGYDVVDYYTIEEDYGTNADFIELMNEAHARGIAVIVDLVLNHTSSQHPWFKAWRTGDEAYAGWYVSQPYEPTFRAPWGADVWHPAGDGRYYYALFWSEMPDLNYRTPNVTAQMEDVSRFWLEEMGADGFRLDAIKYLFEDGRELEHTEETFAWLEGYHDFVHEVEPDTLMVGEVWDSTPRITPYIGNKVDIAFDFDFATAILTAARGGNANSVGFTLSRLVRSYPPGQFATFLTNHDQNRVMNELNEDENAAKVAASLMLTSPGVPFVYYGEEIGMVGRKPDERIRTPMQWDDTQGGGFTTGSAWEPFSENMNTNTVAGMESDPDSLLNHYRALIHLRNDHAALRTGETVILKGGNLTVYAALRYTDDETLLIVVNLGKEAVTDYALTTSMGPLTGEINADMIFGDVGAGEAVAPVINDMGGFEGYKPFESLPPQSSFVIALR